MANRYYRLRLKGERGVDEAQSVVGRRGGMLLRVHNEGGETQVYYAADPEMPGLDRDRGDEGEVSEVSLEEVTKLG